MNVKNQEILLMAEAEQAEREGGAGVDSGIESVPLACEPDGVAVAFMLSLAEEEADWVELERGEAEAACISLMFSSLCFTVQ